MKFRIEIEVLPNELADFLQRLADASGESARNGGENSKADMNESVNVVVKRDKEV